MADLNRKAGIGLATLAIMTLWSAAPAESKGVSQKDVSQDAALSALVDSFTRAQREYDQPKLAALTTADYVEVSPVGDVDTRDEMLSFYAPEKKSASPELVISERSVRRHGDVAVVLAKLSFAAPGQGGAARTVAMRASFVARRTGPTWRLAAAHYTPLRSQRP
jgi:uncharacterized protein (TIGR02246 family)